MTKRIVVGITGASGVIYGIKMLEQLREMDVETHLIISESGKRISKSRRLSGLRKLPLWRPAVTTIKTWPPPRQAVPF